MWCGSLADSLLQLSFVLAFFRKYLTIIKQQVEIKTNPGLFVESEPRGLISN